ncbi:hypothetical protein JK164_07940 [Gluconobacter kondonii]|uniref:hypothetical protein n=1 Tax=Gluconobacter kondonii TaxID=941463 RepID=UPI001B8CB951|nr:hypothetical protein [Gluconobacter kondonii]MBS1065888.1 hypothetical protein [Gluconobacter kondonii]
MSTEAEKAFEAFCAKYGEKAGEEVMERIADAMWTRKGDDRLRINNFHTLNACNHVADGDIEHAGEWFSFSIESGNWNGTVIRGWGDLDQVTAYDPPRPTVYDLMPRDRSLEIARPGMFRVYLLWRREKWFQDLAQSYNYDRHFAPGGKTETYWREKAAARGLLYAPDTEVTERIAAFNAPDFEDKRKETLALASQWSAA